LGGAAGGGGAAPAAAIRVTDFANYQVIQRVLGGTGQTVPVSGTFTGSAVKDVQVQVVDFTTESQVIVAWTPIATSVSAGAFAGTLLVPQGGWYKIAVRALGSNGAELARDVGTQRWGVGINILLIGQSNMVGNGGVFNYTSVPEDLEALYSNDNVWKHLSDPYDGGGLATDVDYDSWVGASMIPSLANALAAQFPTLPLGIVPAARGSSPLHGTSAISWVNRNPANHADPANLYGNSLSNARAVGGVELIVMLQGETDATNMTSQAVYQADLQTLLGYYREDQHLPGGDGDRRRRRRHGPLPQERARCPGATHRQRHQIPLRRRQLLPRSRHPIGDLRGPREEQHRCPPSPPGGHRLHAGDGHQRLSGAGRGRGGHPGGGGPEGRVDHQHHSARPHRGDRDGSLPLRQVASQHVDGRRSRQHGAATSARADGARHRPALSPRGAISSSARRSRRRRAT
jgi:hypothetical protein